MSDHITISLNELRALLRKAFEGVFGHSRDWNAMADTVISLECDGYNGLNIFFKNYPAMHAGRKAIMSRSLEGDFVIEPHGTSLLEYVHLLGDLLLVDAQKTGQAKGRINAATNPEVLKALQRRFSEAGWRADYSIENETIVVALNRAEVTPQKHSDGYYQILDNGYMMTRVNYIKLCEYADKVLVPATEQSRQGAGE